MLQGAVTTSLQFDALRIETHHNHDGNPMEVEVAKAKANLKQQSIQASDRPSVLFAQTVAAVSDVARLLVEKELSIKRFIQRQRTTKFPIEPQTLDDLAIDGQKQLMNHLRDS